MRGSIVQESLSSASRLMSGLTDAQQQQQQQQRVSQPGRRQIVIN